MNDEELEKIDYSTNPCAEIMLPVSGDGVMLTTGEGLIEWGSAVRPLTIEEQIYQYLDNQITDEYPDDLTIEKSYDFKGRTYQTCGNIVVKNGQTFCKAKSSENAKEIAESMNVVYGTL